MGKDQETDRTESESDSGTKFTQLWYGFDYYCISLSSKTHDFEFNFEA